MAQGNVLEVQSCNMLLLIVYFPGIVSSFFHFQAQRLGHNFKELMGKYGEGELQMKEMVDKLMMDATKDDESLLPHIFPPETEYHLSSIFIDTERPLVSPYNLCFTQHKKKMNLWQP